MTRVSRHDRLRDERSDDGPDERCPCCDARRSAPPDCTVCGYPQNSAAWVEHDGC